jgi:hypothetical protein
MTDLDRMEFNGRNHNGETNSGKTEEIETDDKCPGDEELWESLETL